MDSDALLIRAISEAVDEVLDDPRLTPEQEITRLQSLVESYFWDAYLTRKEAEDTLCRYCGDPAEFGVCDDCERERK